MERAFERINGPIYKRNFFPGLPNHELLHKIKIPVLALAFLCFFITAGKGAGLSGTYTIDGTGAGTYKTFTLAVAALTTNGVSGPVVFNVTAATYTENITIGAILGISSTNTVTFRGKGRSLTILTSALSTVNMNGSSYISFDQMSLITTVTGKAKPGYNTVNAANTNFCSITNCIVKGPVGTGILYLINDSNSNNLTVNNSNISGGYYGIYSYGAQSASSSGFLQCTNNRFSGQQNACYYGIFSFQDNFSYNVCDSSNATLPYTMYCQYENGPVINGNKFYATSAIGLDMIQENFYPVAGKPVTTYITNNFFTGSTTDQVYDNPQNLSSTSGGWVFAFNTIYNTTATTYAAGILPQSCGTGTCVFASNIIFSTKGTPLLMNASNSTTAFAQYDGNDINFSTGSISFTYGTTTTTYTTWALYLAAVQGYGYDINGTNFSPTFVNTAKPFDLHLSPTVQGPLGVWVSGITTDIDKNYRIKYTAAGASESLYGGIANNDAAVTSLVSPKTICAGNSASVAVNLANLGSNPITSIQVGWSWDGVGQIAINGGSINLPNDNIVTLGTELFSAGVIHKLKAWPVSPNGGADGKASNDTLVVNIGPALSGSYTINPALGTTATNFPSFTTVAAALNAYGVCGPVTFKISPGTYNEQIQLNYILGTSSINTITFDGVDSSKTILTFSGTAAAPHTFRLNGTSYVTIKRMSILNPSTTGAFAVHLTGGASYNTVTNCIIKVDASTNNTGTLIPVAITGATYQAAGNSGNYNIINNNTIAGGWANVALYGTSATVLCAGNQVTNNVMTGGYLFGINATFQNGFLFSGNKITTRLTVTGTITVIGGCLGSYSGSNYASCIAISATSCTNHVISNNILSANIGGILDASADVSVLGGKSLIYNNMIYGMFSPSTTSYGIEVNIGYNTGVYHNSIYFSSPTGNALYIINTGATAAQGMDVRNNIVYKTSSCAYCAVVTAASFVSIMDYNDFYSLTGNYVNFGGTVYSNMSALKAANIAYNQHAFSEDPGYVNITSGSENLHIKSTSYGLYGTYVGIDKDIDGDARCKDFPNIGIDESTVGKSKPVVKFFITSNIYPGSPSFVYQTAKAGEPKTHQWILNGVKVSDSVVLKTTKFVAGSNTLKLITQYCGGKDSFSMTFNVSNPTAAPVTDFVANKNYISGGEIVTFLDQSSNGPTNWTWQISPDSVILAGTKVPAFKYVFGDNFAQNPQIQFIGSGKYNVCLTAQNGFGKGNKLCKTSYITVIPGVTLGTISTVTDPQGFLYDDGGPNGNYLGGKLTPTIVIAPCADSVYLTFTMFDMSCGNAFVQLYEGKTTTGKRLDPCGGIGLSSGFNGGSSSGTLCATVCMPNVTKPDTFKAKSAMTLQMNDGATALGAGFTAYWWSKPLTGAKKVKAEFTVSGSGDSVCTNGQTNFVNTSVSSPGDIVSYLWDLDGDPTTFECVGSCSTAFWPYFLPGTVKVTLIATSCGGVDTFSKNLTIYNPSAPKAAVKADNLSPAIGDIVFFSAPIPVCVETYKWTITKSVNGSGYATFVNGTHDYSSNPQVKFSDTGYYTVKLYVDNLSGQQKDSITVTKYILVRSAYCVPAVALLNQGMGLSKITFNTLSNTMTQASKEYSNFTTDNTLTTTVAQGVKYPVSISRNPTLNFDALNRSVFIDWNQDGSFTGPGEEAAEDSNSTSNTWNSTITVPRTAKTGATTMRIAINKGNLSNKPCGQNEFGEYQDYRIYIVPFNIPPVITLKGTQAPDTIFYEQGLISSLPEPGYSASSYLYGDLTKFVKRSSLRLGSSLPSDSFNGVAPGIYIYTYALTDSAGNKAISQRRIVKIVKDHTPPVLIVDKPDTTILEVTSSPVPFPAPKVISANDLVDGPLASSVVNDAAKVTTNILGLYVITYTVTDLSGNSSTVYRYAKIIDTIVPMLVLKGNATMDLEVNTPFTDPGFTASDNYYPAPVLNPLVKIKSDLKDSVLGTYSITYSLTDPSGNVATTVTRIVNVIDTLKPLITLIGPQTDSIAVKTAYKDPGVSVFDNYSKGSDLTVAVSGSYYTQFPSGTKTNLIGSYTIIYTVTDKSGNKASVTRFVNVRDWAAPVITLKGISGVSVCRWANYADEGYNLSDNYNANKDITVTTQGSFVTNGGTTIENLLTLQYVATDKSGNTGFSEIRYIQVKSIHDWPCSASGIETGLTLDKYISVYPNPNTGIFNISANLPAQEKIRISITNVLGQEIAVINNGVLLQNTYKVDLSNQPAGMYLLNIVSGTQTLTKRIEIVK
jgi:hypothetical protein